MKREIIFKALRLDGKGWVEGHYYYDLSDGHIIIETVYDSGNGVDVEPHYYQVKHRVNPETACQFTGLEDKNGVKIFEGDHFGNKNFFVNMSDGKWMVGQTILSALLDGILIERVEEIKGNRHTNK